MTLFTFRAFPRATAARIWDLLLVDGPVTLFRVALALLSLAQERLLATDFEGIFEWTKHVPNSELLLAPDVVVSHALSFEVTTDLVAQLTTQYWYVPSCARPPLRHNSCLFCCLCTLL